MKRFLKKASAALAAGSMLACSAAMSVFAASEPTFSEKMAQAGRNTIIGILIVFIVLLVLSLIISLFKFIAPKKKTQTLKKTEYVNVPKTVEAVDEDEELAAVIMAAIIAAEGETISPYAYRLRSIKRVKTPRRWNRAR